MQSGSYKVTARPASTTRCCTGRQTTDQQPVHPNHGVSRKQESGHLPVADILTVAGRADAAHGADEIVVVEQSADLLGTELGCRGPSAESCLPGSGARWRCGSRTRPVVIRQGPSGSSRLDACRYGHMMACHGAS